MSLVLACFAASVTAFRSPLMSSRCHVRMSVDGESDEERRERLQRLGREAAREAEMLDSAGEDGGLSAEFNARLAKEGGANVFKVKSSMNQAVDSLQDGAQKARGAVDDLSYQAGSVTRGLTEQQKNIAKIVVGLIAFNIAIGLIGSAFGGGQQVYSV